MTDQGIINRLILEADNHAAARDRLYMECARLTKAVEDLVEKLASASQERQHAVAALSEQLDTVRAERDALWRLTDRLTAEHDALRAERDEVRQSYCSLMEAYRGGDGRVTANKLGWGYLFPRRPKKEDGK